MKKLISLLTALMLLGGFAFADNIAYASIVPKTAKSMAMGGVFTSVPTGEFSFFGNPASFASLKPTLMLPSVDAWAYLRPTSANITALTSATGGSGMLTQALNIMSQNGGTGGGASVGMGFAFKGLGLGLFATSDEYVKGTNPASAVLSSENEVTSVIGLGLPIKLGDLRLTVGGDLRPFYRVSLEPIALTTVLNAASGDVLSVFNASAFFGVAMDLGASLQLSSFTLGLSVRDIAPSYVISSGKLTAILDSLSGTGLPSNTDTSSAAVFTPDVTAGLAWTPKLLPHLIDPALYFEIQDPVGVLTRGDGAGSALNLIHMGAEVKLLNIFTLRGGLNRGWLSAGAGIKLLFLDVNAAVFTEELGALPGDQPRSGLSLEASFRF